MHIRLLENVIKLESKNCNAYLIKKVADFRQIFLIEDRKGNFSLFVAKAIKLFLFGVIVFYSCNAKKRHITSNKPNFELEIEVEARVSKIDSIADYYLVYIENEKQFFKIVSNKNTETQLSATNIKIDEKYKFKIKQMTDRKEEALNNQFKPVNYLTIVRCLKFNKTEICTESAFELAKSSNLKGLHLHLIQ